MKKIDLLNNRSDFVKEVLETPPNRVITWGNTFFLVFILLVLIMSWLIKYPDIVTSEVTITTKRPPIYLSSKIQGKIDTILRGDQESVVEGNWIAIIESNADLNNITKLDRILQRIKIFEYNLDSILKIEFPILNLGEIQSDYNYLVKSVSKYRQYKQKGNYDMQLNLNTIKLQQFRNLIDEANGRMKVFEKELKIAESDYERNKILFQKGVISSRELETNELRYLQSIRDYENSKSRITEIKSQYTSSLSDSKNFESDETQAYLNFELDILEAVKLTELSFIQWKKNHVLESPISGKVMYMDYFTSNQYIESEKKIVSILPEYLNRDFFGIAKMPILNSGKVKVGQHVNIKLHGFPYEEFGMVLGIVENISEVPNEDFYLVKIKLTKGLITTYDREVTFKQNINGSAEIVTEDLRLLERFIYTLTKALK